MGILFRSGYYDKMPQTGSLISHRRAPLVVQWLRLRSQCRGPGFHPWSGNLVPHCATKYPACRNKDQRFCVQQLRPSAVKQADKQQEFISQKFRRLGTQRSTCQHGCVLVKALLLVHCQHFLIVFHMDEGAMDLSGVSFMRHYPQDLIVSWRPQLLTASPWNVRVSTYEFGR